MSWAVWDSKPPLRVILGIFLWLALVLFHPGQLRAEDAGHTHSEERLLSQIEAAIPILDPTAQGQDLFPYHYSNPESGLLLMQHQAGNDSLHGAPTLSSTPFQSGLATDGFIGSRSRMYLNVNRESSYLPGLMLYGRASPSLDGYSRGIAGQLRLIASKAISEGPSVRRVHLNLSWNYNEDPKESERESSYVAIIGYDQNISPDLLLVLDFVRERDIESLRDLNLLQMGFRYNLTPLAVLSVGAGSSFMEDSPAFRATFGFHLSF